MPDLEFIAEGHIYKVKGQRWVSVTEVLPKSPYMKNNEEARLKGEYVHSMCRLYLLNDLVEPVDPVLQPYLEALKLFLKESQGMNIHGVIDIKSGAKVATVELQIAAYIELVNNGHPFDSGRVEGEAKRMYLETSLYHPTYQFCGTPDIVLGDIPVKEGHALYLKNNGKYKLEKVENLRSNFNHFLCKLDSYKWDREKGYVK